MFPWDSVWHADASVLPVHPNSDTYVASIGVSNHVHADFGSGTWDGGPIGIPYDVVSAGQPTTSVTFDYDDESDHVPYPIPADPSIEGGSDSTGDRHVIVLDNSNCTIYELYAAYPNGDGTWHAGLGRGVEPQQQRAATRHLDVGRRGRTPDSSWTRSL